MLVDWTECLKRGFDEWQVFFFYDVESRLLKQFPLETSTGYINGVSSCGNSGSRKIVIDREQLSSS